MSPRWPGKWFPGVTGIKPDYLYTRTIAPKSFAASGRWTAPGSGVGEQRGRSCLRTDTQCSSSRGSPMQPPGSAAVPTGARPAFAFFPGKSTLASAPRWPLSRSGRPGKWRGRRQPAPGRRQAAVQPAAPVAAAKPSRAAPGAERAPTCSGFSPAAGRRRLRDVCPGPQVLPAARRPIADPLTWPEARASPPRAPKLGSGSWGVVELSAPPGRPGHSCRPHPRSRPHPRRYPARPAPARKGQCKVLPAPVHL